MGRATAVIDASLRNERLAVGGGLDLLALRAEHLILNADDREIAPLKSPRMGRDDLA